MADYPDSKHELSGLPSARLTLGLLGPPRVLVRGESVIGLGSKKAVALLAYLALEAHRPHLRSALAALFWPDQPEKQALQNLRQTLARVRRAIDDRAAIPPHLITDSQTVQFNIRSDYWLDVAAFQHLLTNTQRHPHRRLEACPTCVSQLSQASELYRGDFVADVYVSGSSAFDEWLSILREQLRLQACTALQALANSHLARGESEAARHFARRLLHLDPWNEAVHRLLLRALALSEGRNAALWHFDTLRQVLANELGVEPEDATLAVVEQIRAGKLQDVQPCTLIAHLPTPATPFVGREAEREQISDYLAGHDQRLITLYGTGGSGKTRLALEIAAEQAPLWRDGVWFVPLAGVPAADQLVDAVAAALDLRGTGGPVEPGALIDFLRPKELLLILDSFEHLLTPPQSPPRSGERKGGVDLLRDILRWAPEVRVLVTSRARLGLRGEWAVRLEGLDMPPGPHPSPSQVEGASAVRLFVNSARRLKPDFTLLPECLPAVIRICQLVGGLPLGIELAAAWVRMFSCQQIANEIERSPDFLSNPRSDNPGRQHSLRATFEYSYNLLSEREGALFRKLSVFRGGFTTEAAQRVTGAGLSGLASLLDKSLLQTSPSRRLDVHLALQEYATEKLMAIPGEEQWTRERHCRVYLPFVQEREETLTGEHSKEALEEIDVELGNVRAAWRWAVAQGKMREIEPGIDGLARFYDLRGLYQEAETAFESAADSMLASAQEEVEAQRVACRLLLEQARFLLLQALHTRAIQVAQAAIDLAQTVQEQTWEARGIFLWGDALFRQGDYEMARLQFERALSLVQATEDGASQELTPTVRGAASPGLRPEQDEGARRAVEAKCLNSLAAVCWGLGDYAGSEAYLEQTLRMAVGSGDRQGEARVLGNLGVVAVEQGDYARARSCFQESLRMRQAIGERRGEGIALGNLGNVLLYLGAYPEAKTHYTQALQIQREIGDRQYEAVSVGNLGLLYHYLGENETAREYSRQALEMTQEIGARRAEGAMWLKLGHASAGLGQLDEAATAYRKAVALQRELGRLNQATEPLAGLAGVALAQGKLQQARAYVEEILSHLQAGGTLDGAIDPFQIHLTCYRVLHNDRDRRAREVLTTAHNLLQERAAKIGDEKMRRSFLENVASHREIVREAANGGESRGSAENRG